MNNSFQKKHYLGLLLTSTIFFFTLTGCQPANYGKFKLSRDVEKIFISRQVLPDYKYYYSGSNVRPDAIMAIHPNYTLDDELWTKIRDPQKELKLWFRETHKMLSAHTYYILSPEGKQIGIYYSRWRTGTVKMGENNQVIITPPDREADMERPRLGK